MAPVEIIKPTAAQRQIDAAIQMLFLGIDILAVHTVIAAAHAIAKDLTVKRNNVSTEDTFDDVLESSLIKFLTEQCRRDIGRDPSHDEIQNNLPRLKRLFMNQFNQPANFLKHADRDATLSLDEGSLATDHIILFSCMEYATLGFDWTPEMHVFLRWHLAVYPQEESDRIQTEIGYLHQLARADQLEFGRTLLIHSFTSERKA